MREYRGIDVARPVGRAVEGDETTALEQTIDDGFGQIGVVEDFAPGGGGLVCGQDHGSFGKVTVVDEVVEDVGCVGAVGQVAHLVDDQDMDADVGTKNVLEAASPRRPGQVIDESGRGGEHGLEAVLDGAVGNGDCEVSLAPAAAAMEDQVAPVGDEVRTEVAA